MLAHQVKNQRKRKNKEDENIVATDAQGQDVLLVAPSCFPLLEEIIVCHAMAGLHSLNCPAALGFGGDCFPLLVLNLCSTGGLVCFGMWNGGRAAILSFIGGHENGTILDYRTQNSGTCSTFVQHLDPS